MNFPKNAYINRELAWLEFNQRVLDQACEKSQSLLERLKFLAISGSNLDEFFMVRVGGLQIQQEKGVTFVDPSGRTVREQLDAIFVRVRKLYADQYACLLDSIEPKLENEDFVRVQLNEATTKQKEMAARIFHEDVFPVLSPMAIGLRQRFPLLKNLGLYLAVRLFDTESESGFRISLVPLTPQVSRCFSIASEKGYSYVLSEDLVATHLDSLFPGEEILESVAFRITRNLDISVREDEAPDLMTGMEEVLSQRRTADCIRLEVADSVSPILRESLQSCFDLDPEDVFDAPGPIDLAGLMPLSDTDGFASLKESVWAPQRSAAIDPAVSMFDTIAQRDILLCHPYESYDPVVRFLDEAARDPDVLAIKHVLYRASKNSAIVRGLKEAAERGKYVTAIVELKARFDEEKNIEWANELERAGVQVVYGVRRLKTHAKVCLVVRREPQGIQRYIHFGTGNYNEATARFYSDISYFTCNEEFGSDVTAFFNAITGYSDPTSYRRIEAAPLGLRKKLVAMIKNETKRKKQGQKAHIAAKLNALVDPELIAALYEASQAGVQVRLNIRGACCLRPGVKGLSENIRVVSIIDRYLEHARIMYFYHGGDDNVFISSADWMPRNLDRRIELLVPIYDLNARQRLIDILDAYFCDNTNAWDLKPDGTYERIHAKHEEGFRVQKHLYEQAVAALEKVTKMQKAVFEPHQATDIATP